MKSIILGFSLIVIGSISFGQNGSHTCSRLKAYSFSNQSRSNTLPLNHIALTEEYDVHFYHLDVNLERTSTDISGVVEIHAKSLVATLDSVIFELHSNLTINSILMDGLANTSFTRVGSAVIVPANYALNDNFVITIDYTGTPPDGATNPLGGGGMTNGSSPSWGNQVTWSLSEPFSAFEWWPCKQSLTDKADSSYVFVTTDETNMAGSNGVLTNTVDLGNGKKRFEWKSKYPIDYYLISVSVAEYIEYNIYANPTGVTSPILIQNFIYNNPATLTNFQDEIDNTADFIEYFSDLFGMYPFANEKYGHCMAPLSGGMEHQTMTTQGWFEDGLTAHELGHQWFGNNVTCATWSDIWLNEGFASYADYLMVEHFTPIEKTAKMLEIHNNVMSQDDGAVWCEDSLNGSRIFSGRLSYDKGAAIVHTLRFLINDDAKFFEILQQYQSDFGGSTARLNDFKLIAEGLSGLDLTAFFDEWYYGEGFPTYSAEWNQLNSQIFIDISQVNSAPAVTNLFTNDLEIQIVGADGATITQRVAITQNNQIVSIDCDFEVESIQIDPNNWIINESGTTVENNNVVGLLESENQILVYPNPVTDKLFIENTAAQESYVIYDLKGVVVMSSILKTGVNSINVKELSAGTYIVKVGNSKKEIIIR